MTKSIPSITILALAACGLAAPMTVDLEDVPIESESAWFGPFASRGATFSNYNDFTWGPYWEGFACSSKNDVTTPGLASQFAAYGNLGGSLAGGGAGGAGNYAVGFIGFVGTTPEVTFPEVQIVRSALFTNVTYTALSMLEGDAFSKKFGGDDGSEEDWYKLTIIGKDAAGDDTGEVDLYLADYRFADSGQDYVVDDWTQVDLGGLGPVKGLVFALSSTDNGVFGMNTPAYFAMDNLVYVPEPVTMVLLAVGAIAALGRGQTSRARR